MSAQPTFERSAIAGAGLVAAPWHADHRGSFTKPYSPAMLKAIGAPFYVAEVYWSTSATGAIRGMHFQVPPHAMAKLVFVVTGLIRDVVADLRRGSPTYGTVVSWDLEPSGHAVLVPIGCAHGFEVIEGPAAVCYLQDGPFDASADAGVRWDSVGAPWTVRDPILSDRDACLPPLAEFDSPFVWESR